MWTLVDTIGGTTFRARKSMRRIGLQDGRAWTVGVRWSFGG
jgi:hypothetical protein